MNIITKIRIRCCSPTKRAEYYKRLGLSIGKKCSVGAKVSFSSESYLITIGNHVRINEGVKFVTHDGGAWVLRGLAGAKSTEGVLFPQKLEHADLFGRITVGDNVHIGTNAFIMPGVKIGNNCIIGVGAIVTRDIPDNSVAVGIPARVIESIDEYYLKHENDFIYTNHLSAAEKKKNIVEHKL